MPILNTSQAQILLTQAQHAKIAELLPLAPVGLRLEETNLGDTVAATTVPDQVTYLIAADGEAHQIGGGRS